MADRDPRLDTWTAAWIEPVDPDDVRAAPAAGPSPRHGVPRRRAGAIRDAPHHRARCLRGVPERHADRRPRAHARLHGVPQATPGADLRRHRARQRGRERPRRAAQRRLVARPARHRAPDRLVRHDDGAARRAARHARSPARSVVVATDAHLAIDPEPRPRRRPRRRRGARPAPSRPRLGRAGHRPLRMDAGARRRPRLRHAVRADRAAVPAGARSCRPSRSASSRRGRHVVDFGQNSHGWIRLADLGPAGTTLTIAHGEALDAAGDVTQDNIEHSQFAPPRDVPRAVPDRRRHLRRRRLGVRAPPQHEGLPLRPHRGPPRAARPGVDHERRGAHRSATASATSRAPTSASIACTRRRSGASAATPARCPPTAPRGSAPGWTGDWQIFVDTAAYLYDVVDFSVKWLRDLAAEQRPDGAVLHIVPDPHDFERGSGFWNDSQGSAGWGDAAVHVPWELYLATGRTDFLAPTSSTSMRRWVDFAAGRAATGRHPDRVAARPRAAPPRALPLGQRLPLRRMARARRSRSPTRSAASSPMDHGPTATAYLYRSADELSRIAALLGDRNDQRAVRRARRERARRLAHRVHRRRRTRPPRDAGQPRARARVRSRAGRAARARRRRSRRADPRRRHPPRDRLPRHAVPAAGARRPRPPRRRLRAAVPGQRAVVARDDRPRRHDDLGAVGRRDGRRHRRRLAQPLQQGRRDLASCTATSPGSSASSPATGASASRRGLAAGITHARTHHDSPHGRIEVAWRLDGDDGSIDVTVPPGTEAELALPGGRAELLAPGRHHRTNISRAM